MLDRSISTSRKLSKVDDKTALIYTWLQPHTDSFGRMDGDAYMIKATVVPLRDYSIEDVEKSLKMLEVNCLIERYKVDEDTYLEVTGFDEHQTFKPSRARVGHFPNKDGVVPRVEAYEHEEYGYNPKGGHVADSGRTVGGRVADSVPLSKVKLSKVKLSKVKLSKGTKVPEIQESDIYGEYQNVYMTVSEYERLHSFWFAGDTSLLDDFILQLSTYIKSNGFEKKYKSHSATILAWAKKKHEDIRNRRASKGKTIVGI